MFSRRLRSEAAADLFCLNLTRAEAPAVYDLCFKHESVLRETTRTFTLPRAHNSGTLPQARFQAAARAYAEIQNEAVPPRKTMTGIDKRNGGYDHLCGSRPCFAIKSIDRS